MDTNVQKYLDYLKYERKLSNNTYLSYSYNLMQFMNFFIKKNLLKLETNDIRDFLYQDRIKARTRAHYLTVINSFYNYLIDENVIKNNLARQSNCLNLKRNSQIF